MRRLINIKVLLPLALAALISGCGSGGGGGGGAVPSSNWDTLVWDQDNWA